jgi:hypothetical protein
MDHCPHTLIDLAARPLAMLSDTQQTLKRGATPRLKTAGLSSALPLTCVSDQQTTAANGLGRRQLRGVDCASQLRHFHVTGLSQTLALTLRQDRGPSPISGVGFGSNSAGHLTI